MNIIDILLYKKNEITGQKRISKTKAISLVVFVAFFMIFIFISLTSPQFADESIILLLFSSIIGGLSFAVPIFIVGWVLDKLLQFFNKDSNNTPVYNQTYNNQQYNNSINQDYNDNYQNTNPNLYNQDFSDINYAQHFKEAINKNEADNALDILSRWNDNNDANYKYAKIIFEGMPPSDLSSEKLNEWLLQADNLNAKDESIKSWFRSTALEVINLNNN